jgi:predicted lipoprotein with Yx(FWY)xxD motif
MTKDPLPDNRPRLLRSMRRPLLALTALAAAGAIAAGCGSSTSGSGGSSSGGGGGGGYGGGGSPTTGGQATAPTVSTSTTKLGQILVDASGRTLYLFQEDQPNQSACSAACAAAWPVDQTARTPKAASGVRAAMLGIIKRTDGTTQVTYNQHPLYYYSGGVALVVQHRPDRLLVDPALADRRGATPQVGLLGVVPAVIGHSRSRITSM